MNFFNEQQLQLAMSTPTKINLLAYLFLAIFVGLSIIIPNFSVVIFIIAVIWWAVTTYIDRPAPFVGNPVDCDVDLENFRYYKHSYLNSPEWKLRRKQIHARDKSCRLCGSTDHLNVHHRHYRTLTNEHPSDLVLVCSSCHTALHKAIGYPQTYEDYMSFTDPTKYKGLPCI